MTEPKPPWDIGHSTLLDKVEPTGGSCIRRGKLHCKGPGPWAGAAQDDAFASHQKGPCVDLAGCHWPAHDFDELTARCRRCRGLRRMEAL